MDLTSTSTSTGNYKIIYRYATFYHPPLVSPYKWKRLSSLLNMMIHFIPPYLINIILKASLQAGFFLLLWISPKSTKPINVSSLVRTLNKSTKNNRPSYLQVFNWKQHSSSTLKTSRFYKSLIQNSILIQDSHDLTLLNSQHQSAVLSYLLHIKFRMVH